MMVFDLGCGEGHRFEGWFESGADFERQLAEGLLSCPVCGGNHVERVPSTFGIGASSRSGGESAGEPSPAAFFKRITEFVKSNFMCRSTSSSGAGEIWRCVRKRPAKRC